MSHIRAYPTVDAGTSGAMNITGTVVSDKRALDVSIAAGSVSIVGPIAVTQSGTWDINDIIGTISLPTGAATEATLLAASSTLTTIAGLDFATETTLSTVSGTLSTIAGLDFATETTLSALNTKIPTGLTVTSTRLLVDGSGVTQPVSGTVSATQSGAWTVTVNQPVSIDDNGGSITVDGTVAATQSGTWNINNISGTVSLPTGAATAANQLPDGHNVTVDNSTSNAVPVEENVANGGSTSTSSITTTASSVGGVANQVALAIFPIGTGRYYFNIGGTATTSNAYITLSSPLILESYSGSVSLIRSSGSGSVQVSALTRS